MMFGVKATLAVEPEWHSLPRWHSAWRLALAVPLPFGLTTMMFFPWT